MPTNILNLPTFDVLKVVEDKHDYHIRVETKQAPTVCACCGSDNIIGSGRRENLVKDLPMHGKRVGISVIVYSYAQAVVIRKTVTRTLLKISNASGCNSILNRLESPVV